MSKYERVPVEENGQLARSSIPLKNSRQSILWILQIGIFILSLTFFLAGHAGMASNCRCHESGIYSPAQSAIEYTVKKFEGYLNHESVYKGKPRKELDDAWEALSPGSILPGPTLTITEEELQRLGKGSTENATVRVPPALGGEYFATLEVFHNLHCLNLVRMATYKEHYDTEHAFGDHWLRSHIDHCIDMIRQRLTCTADIGLVTAVWVEGYSEPYPDFSTRHECRDFDKIKSWALERSLNVTMDEMVAARGPVSLAEPPK